MIYAKRFLRQDIEESMWNIFYISADENISPRYIVLIWIPVTIFMYQGKIIRYLMSFKRAYYI